MKNVLIILPNGFEVFEGAAFIDVLGWANVCGDTPINVVKAGVSKSLTCTFGGFQIVPDAVLADVCEMHFDAVAIPGGFERSGYYDEAFSEPVLSTLRHFHEKGAILASICVGALPIAKSGCLDGRKATTYHLDEGRWRKQLEGYGVNVVDAPIVTDGNIITSTAPGTAIEVGFLLLEKLTSRKNADDIRVQMGF